MSRRHGFTLIELLVVLAIIALLMSILLPSLKGARDQAKFAVCHSNAKQIGIAVHTYAADCSGWYPVPIRGYGPFSGSWTNSHQSWPRSLAKAGIIPEASREQVTYPSGVTTNEVPDDKLGVYQCPLEHPRPSVYRPETYGRLRKKLSYSSNFSFTGFGTASDGSKLARGVKVITVDRPAQRLLYIEHNSGLAALPPWYDPWWDGNIGTTYSMWWRLSDHSRPGFVHLASNPKHTAIHGDGHVEAYSPEMTFRDLNPDWAELWNSGSSGVIKWRSVDGHWVREN